MRTTIDSAGRLVVPKALRGALGLTGGSEVELTLADGAVELRPVPRPVRVERHEDGKPVLMIDEDVEPLTADDVRRLVEETRR